MSREHPLLMKGPLVVATLAGRKTQTRRLVTPANSTAYGWPSARAVWPLLDLSRALPGTMTQTGGPPVGLWRVPLRDAPEDEQDSRVMILPRVRTGDALWVRETWRAGSEWDADAPSMIDRNADHQVLYMADGRASGPEPCYGWGKTRTAIHMPRWACRAVLPVTDVRAERLQDISEEDARAEGMTKGQDGWWNGARHTVKGSPKAMINARKAFSGIWDEINGKREGARWADNPMLWAYTYKLGGAP